MNFAMNKSLSNVHLILRRQIHRNAELLDNCVEVKNRNPRNLEFIRVARKPDGFHLEKPFRNFWHKLSISKGSRTISAAVIHYENGPVITVSSGEWAIKNQLYSLTDSSAYINVGKVLAQRCLESGIYEMKCDDEEFESGKINLLLEEVEKAGICLKEADRYKKPDPWDKYRPEKPWEVVE